MGQPGVDDVHLVDAGGQGLGGGGQLGDHAAGDDAIGDQRFNIALLDMGYQGRPVGGIPQQAGDVRQVDQLPGLEGLGEGRGGVVGVDIVGVAVRPAPERRDDRDGLPAEGVGYRSRVDGGDLADVAPIDGGAGVGIRAQESAGGEKIRAADPGGAIAGVGDHSDQMRVHLFV